MIWIPVVGKYADIDVYASVLAYEDLLNQRGKLARNYIPKALNYSVPKELRIIERENSVFDLKPDDEAIILDISIPAEINRLVPDKQILEIIDHHPGYEDYWHEKIGNKAIIEKIGAVATSIFEWWGECWDYDKMSSKIAKLLLGAILDNTLNFNADITTERDRQASKKLANIAHVELDDFTSWYFSAVSKTISDNLEKALTQDCKKVAFSEEYPDVNFGQITIWDCDRVLSETAEITGIMERQSEAWVVSVICISEGKNYFLTSSQTLSNYLSKLLRLEKHNEWLVSHSLFLRKEIIKKILEKHEESK